MREIFNFLNFGEKKKNWTAPLSKIFPPQAAKALTPPPHLTKTKSLKGKEKKHKKVLRPQRALGDHLIQ